MPAARLPAATAVGSRRGTQPESYRDQNSGKELMRILALLSGNIDSPIGPEDEVQFGRSSERVYSPLTGSLFAKPCQWALMNRLLVIVDVGVVNLDNEISEGISNLISKCNGGVVIDDQIYTLSNCDGPAIDGPHVPSKLHPVGNLAIQCVAQDHPVSNDAQFAYDQWTSAVVCQGHNDLVFKIVTRNGRKRPNGKPVVLSLRPQRKHSNDKGQHCSHAR